MFNLIFDQVTSLLSQGHDIIISTQDSRIMEYWKDKLLVFAFSKIPVNEISEIQHFFLLCAFYTSNTTFYLK